MDSQGDVSEVLGEEDLLFQSGSQSYEEGEAEAGWEDNDGEGEEEGDEEYEEKRFTGVRGGRSKSRGSAGDDEDFIKSLGLGFEPASLPGDITL